MAVIRMAFAIIALCLAHPLWAQNFDIPDVTYPELVQQGVTINSFVPKGWLLELSRKGDLNKDGISDYVLVLRSNDPKNIVRNDSLGPSDFNTNPRILTVLFGTKNRGYDRIVDNHALIPRNINPTMEDPLDSVAASGIEICNGNLKVQLGIFFNAGSWSMGSKTYTLRWQHGAFRLIGFDDNNVQRNSGETTNISINYLTGRIKKSSASIEDNAEKISWRKVRVKPLLSIDQIGDGLDFPSVY
jgi:hypothetical protein